MAPRIGRDCGTVNFLNGVPRSPWARRRSRTLPGSNLSDQLDGAIRNHRKKDSADLRRQATTHQATAVYSQPLNPAHMSMSPSMNPVNLLSLQSSPAMLPMSMPPMGHFDIPAAANGVAHSNYSSPMLNANDASMYFNPMAVTSGSIDAFPPMPAVASLPSSVNLQKAVSAEATLDPTAVAQAVAAVQQQQHHHHHGAGSPATNINGPTPGFQGFHGTYSWMSPTANSTSTSPDSQASALVNIATSNSALAPNTDLGLFSSAEMAAQAFSNIDWKSSTTPAGYEDPATKLTSLPTSSEADASSAQLPNSSA
ncbi:hypothetical protein EV182_006026 [Spiromyces aspiralis]|uniref:Uncharacterized protein n=1 Tax=Spiromyces aspiralis TaxID=68401 RepID=A0ACC1HT34_9FUNG|nr:hypothetical protein EV182_006026 [Spiromyces aspiralis]